MVMAMVCSSYRVGQCFIIIIIIITIKGETGRGYSDDFKCQWWHDLS